MLDFYFVLIVLVVEKNEAVDSEFSHDVFGDDTDWISNITEEIAAFPDTPVSRSFIKLIFQMCSVCLCFFNSQYHNYT